MTPAVPIPGLGARPVVKWAGGKGRQVPLLLPMIPAHVRTYAEPFAGGAALFFALAGEVLAGRRARIARFLLGDANPDLVAIYRALAESPFSVVEALKGYENTEAAFRRARVVDGATLPLHERAARALFLNRTCFNGLWRTNALGVFNAPFGRYKNPRLVDEPKLMAVAGVLRTLRVEILCTDFTEVMGQLGKDDFAFLDPPYDVRDEGSFTTYTARGFSLADQARVMATMRALRSRGGHALLTNHDTKRIRSLAHGLFLKGITAPRAIAANGSRTPAREVVVRTWR